MAPISCESVFCVLAACLLQLLFVHSGGVAAAGCSNQDASWTRKEWYSDSSAPTIAPPDNRLYKLWISGPDGDYVYFTPSWSSKKIYLPEENDGCYSGLDSSTTFECENVFQNCNIWYYFELLEVSCGSHTAIACSLCPNGHGESWCHGDCHWSNDECVAVQSEPTYDCSTSDGCNTACGGISSWSYTSSSGYSCVCGTGLTPNCGSTSSSDSSSSSSSSSSGTGGTSSKSCMGYESCSEACSSSSTSTKSFCSGGNCTSQCLAITYAGLIECCSDTRVVAAASAPRKAEGGGWWMSTILGLFGSLGLGPFSQKFLVFSLLVALPLLASGAAGTSVPGIIV
mmetsp:Transcript_86484/g.181087  ORF Transcript_86484/g.181087 Transcript_86484/m.181087 type:complete len:341 (+) Transcript_86484:619-1641(+)